MHDAIEQFDALLEGDLSAAEAEALSTAIAADPALADAFAEYAAQHAALHTLHRAAKPEPETPNAGGSRSVKPDPREATFRVPLAAFRVGRIAARLAAALLLAAAVVAICVVALNRPSPVDPARPIPTAVLLDAEGVDWVSEPLGVGSTLERRAIEISGGTLRLQTMSGAELALEGPASMSLVSGNRVSLTRGRLHARAEGGGFVVDTPRFTVTDLSTEFAVGVGGATGDSTVAAYEGRVRIDGVGSPTELIAGGGWRMAADGTVHTAAASELFVRPRDTDSAAARYASAVRADRPRVYWRFEADLDRAVINSAGAGFAATLNGKSKLEPGPLGRALRMSDRRGGDAATCDAIPALMTGPQYTIELWVRLDAEQRGTLVSLGDLIYLGVVPTGERGVTEPSVRFLHRPRAGGGESRDVNLFAPIEPDRWHHVAAVKSADTMMLYIDGAAVATAPQPAGLEETAPVFAIGRLSTRRVGWGDIRSLIGQIDEVAIYDYPLAAEQIARHVQAAENLSEQTQATP